MSAKSLLHNRRILRARVPKANNGVGMTRGQQPRVLRVVESVNNLFAVLLAEVNRYRESESEVLESFSSINEFELISFNSVVRTLVVMLTLFSISQTRTEWSHPPL